MKTAVEIPDSLLREAEEVADREHTTLETLLAEGLRLMGDWETIRSLAYEGGGE